jgi:Ca2+-binding RTX toxin-like protein
MPTLALDRRTARGRHCKNSGTNSVDMTGSTDFVVLYGGASVDTLRTGSGGGYLIGGAGDDHLFGGAGPNVFIGGQGTDDMHGGTGVNTYYIGATDTVAGAGVYNTVIELTQNVTRVLGSPGLTGVQQIILNSGTNSVDGSSATTQLFIYGGSGADTIKGGTRPDYFFGGLGANTFKFGVG